MVYQVVMASLGLLEWPDRRENRAHLDLKVRRVKIFPLMHTSNSHNLFYITQLIFVIVVKYSRQIVLLVVHNECMRLLMVKNVWPRQSRRAQELTGCSMVWGKNDGH